MKDFFKPTDFDFKWDDRFGSPQDMAAHQANEKLNKLRAESIPVYGVPSDHDWSSVLSKRATHSAVITFVEELPPGVCMHIPEFSSFKFIINNGKAEALDLNFLKCLNCGIDLQATWAKK